MQSGKIKIFRKLRGFSQEEMARKLHMDQSSYSRIETNEHKLTVDLVKNISEILEVPLEELNNEEPVIVQHAVANNETQYLEKFFAEQRKFYEEASSLKKKEIVTLERIHEALEKIFEKLNISHKE